MNARGLRFDDEEEGGKEEESTRCKTNTSRAVETGEEAKKKEKAKVEPPSNFLSLQSFSLCS